jgi:hypothetical protein
MKWPVRICGAIVGLVLALSASSVYAHGGSDAYLSLDVRQRIIEVRWDIALRDLDYVLGLDADRGGELSWGEVRARADAIEAYALGRLDLRASNTPCPVRPVDRLVERHADATYYVLLAQGRCGETVQRLDVAYSLLFDADTMHRGLLKLTSNGTTRTSVFAPGSQVRGFDLTASHGATALAGFVASGVRHILDGYDHLLFLLSLLLPAVALRRASTWQPVESLRPVLLEVLRTVTAFTVAHSITFMLAAYGAVELPPRFVEAAIAASVVVAALNNVVTVVETRRWVAAFVFGLVHGFGFASLLSGLELPPGLGRALPLLGFNVGVELGQVAIVALMLPLLFGLRRTAFYRRAVLVGGSCLIAAIGAAWFLERAFALPLPWLAS